MNVTKAERITLTGGTEMVTLTLSDGRTFTKTLTGKTAYSRANTIMNKVGTSSERAMVNKIIKEKTTNA